MSGGISTRLGGRVYQGRLAVRTAAGVVLGSDQQFITFTGGKVVAWNADGVFQTNLPPDLSDARLALLEEDLGWLGERGVQVSVCRDRDKRIGPRLEATRHRPYAPRGWLGSRSSYTGRF